VDYERIRQQLARGTTLPGETDQSDPSTETSEEAATPTTPDPRKRRQRRRDDHRERAVAEKEAARRSLRLPPAPLPAPVVSEANRHIMRQLALLALFELDVTSHDYEDVVRRVIADPFLSSGRIADQPADEPELDIPAEALRDEALLEQGVRDLVYGVIRAAGGIDGTITEVAPQYPIDRIGTIDRNILRLAIYELEYVRDQPIPRVVSGYVDLGKRFGGDSTASFVNGVLRTVADRIPEDERERHQG
jgi:transcription antitermination protein NusB